MIMLSLLCRIALFVIHASSHADIYIVAISAYQRFVPNTVAA